LVKALQTLVAAGDWEGTATELIQSLSGIVNDETRKDKCWPKDARAMNSKVRRLAPLLRQAGMDVDFETRGHEKTKVNRRARRLKNGLPPWVGPALKTRCGIQTSGRIFQTRPCMRGCAEVLCT
jgi:hypothetical protein